MFTVALVDHKAVNIACNEHLFVYNKKMIPLLFYVVPVSAVLRKINRRVFVACEQALLFGQAKLAIWASEASPLARTFSRDSFHSPK